MELTAPSLRKLLPLLMMLACAPLWSQSVTPSQLLEKSIAYHDPEGQWGRLRADFEILAERPGGSDRVSAIHMDQPASLFRIRVEQDDVRKTYQMHGGHCRLWYRGESEFPEETAASENLTCERAALLRDYYSYLYGLPMKLRDPGTVLEPEVTRTEFHGKEYLVIEVRYEPGTGSDTWRFYFDPETSALGAYQFFHDVAANDGEYILLEGEAAIGAIRVPALRKWYRNDTGEYLGSDLLQPAGRRK